MRNRENARQWVHIGCVSFALLLRFLTWWQAAALAAIALVFNLVVLPRIGGRSLYRPADEARGFPLGIVLYPISVLLLILIFPSRLDIAAAAWAILGVGDGVATLVGRSVGGARWPWSRDKTVLGSAAFAVSGGAAAVFLAWWTRPAVTPLPPMSWTLWAPAAAALIAAAVETIPVRLDDNLSVPFAAAGMLWLATLIDGGVIAVELPGVVGRLPWAIGANVAVAWAGHRAHTVSASGAVVGAFIGIVIYLGGGSGAWLLLLATFLAAAAASRVGLERKSLLGIAEERGGRRGGGNAIANCGVAAIAAVLVVASRYPGPALAALAAALAAGGSDTVASEIGKAFGRSTFLVANLSRVKPGTPGAMSFEGTAAGIVAAFALAALAAALAIVPGMFVVRIVVAATAGALVESLLAATMEGRGLVNNDMLNFINTAAAAAVVLAIA